MIVIYLDPVTGSIRFTQDDQQESSHNSDPGYLDEYFPSFSLNHRIQELEYERLKKIKKDIFSFDPVIYDYIEITAGLGGEYLTNNPSAGAMIGRAAKMYSQMLVTIAGSYMNDYIDAFEEVNSIYNPDHYNAVKKINHIFKPGQEPARYGYATVKNVIDDADNEYHYLSEALRTLYSKMDQKSFPFQNDVAKDLYIQAVEDIRIKLQQLDIGSVYDIDDILRRAKSVDANGTAIDIEKELKSQNEFWDIEGNFTQQNYHRYGLPQDQAYFFWGGPMTAESISPESWAYAKKWTLDLHNLNSESSKVIDNQTIINSLLADSATAADKSTEAIKSMTYAQYWQQQNAALAEYVDELLHHNEVIKVTQADWNALKVKVEDFESPDLIDEEDWAEAIQEEYNAHYIPFSTYINNDMDVAPYNISNNTHYFHNSTLDRCNAAA